MIISLLEIGLWKIQKKRTQLAASPFYYFARFSLISFMSGAALPSTMRSVDWKPTLSWSMRVTIFVAVVLLPSRWVFVALISHLSPSFVQVASPKPPVVSKVQERIVFATGSQPIHWVASPRDTSLKVVVNVLIRKF